jgi:hypothetical protein
MQKLFSLQFSSKFEGAFLFKLSTLRPIFLPMSLVLRLRWLWNISGIELTDEKLGTRIEPVPATFRQQIPHGWCGITSGS